MSKHTPGPWYRRSRIAGGFEITSIPEGLRIAMVQGTVGTADQFNARLIAAAPELLAACKDMFDLLTEPGVMDIDEWKAWKRRAEGTAQIAIAKAEVME